MWSDWPSGYTLSRPEYFDYAIGGSVAGSDTLINESKSN